MNLKISIVIPTYNNDFMINRILKSLSTTTLPKSVTEIIVVENGPRLNVENTCKNFQQQLPLKYIYTEQGSLSNARNLGIKNSTNGIIIFFDNDMLFEKNTLSEYDKVIQQYGDQCFYGGPVLADYEEKPPEWLRDFLPWSASGHSLGDEIISIDKALFLGGNHAFSRKLLEEFDGYDDMCATGEEGMMGEERRLQEKALRAGYQGIYVPGAVAHHWILKDRCSQDWTIHRKYRAGLTIAVTIKNSLPAKPCLLFGIPCYIVKDYYVSLFNYNLSIFLLNSKQQVFSKKFKLAYLKGIIAGFKSL